MIGAAPFWTFLSVLSFQPGRAEDALLFSGQEPTGTIRSGSRRGQRRANR